MIDGKIMKNVCHFEAGMDGIMVIERKNGSMETDMIQYVRNDKFAAHVGIELEKVEPGHAVVSLVLNENHLNGVGIVQGGVIFTLADYAFAAASNSMGVVTLGINASISYFKSPRGKHLTAEANEVSRTNRLSHYNVDVFDEDKTLIARFNSTGYIKK